MICDEHGNIIRTDSNDADGSLSRTINRIYDERNRLIETSTPHNDTENSVTKRTLDAESNLVALIDPNGQTSSTTFDPVNRPGSTTHRLAGVTEYIYDELDRITKVTAPNGVITEYTYDVLGRRLIETSADRGTRTYTYDLANNLTSMTDGRGVTVTYSYDELERLKTVNYPNSLAGKDESVTSIYDTCAFGLGRVCSVTDESGSTGYEYDAYGNLSQQSHTELGQTYMTSYTYDDGDNIETMTYPGGRVVTLQRDGVRRLSQIDTIINGNPQTLVSDIQYRSDNQMIQCTVGNGLIDSRSYDLQGRLTQQLLKDNLDTVTDQRAYHYDKNSNIINIDTNVEDNQYGYDALDRITSDGINTQSPLQYQYDINDNRLLQQRADTSLTATYRYGEQSNQLHSVETLITGTEPLAATSPDRELVYNDAGRLYQLYEAGSLKAEYLYNAQGQRTEKIIHHADNTTTITIYHYDLMGYLISETSETGALIKDYIWNEGMQALAQIDNNNGGTETLTYLHSDHLMTSRLATDDNQTIIWRWEGQAFGNTAAEELANIRVNVRFPGQYFDSETNLHYNWNRYYDPVLGRYITSDPIGLRGGRNTYLYALANPIMSIDRFGLETTVIVTYDYGIGSHAAVHVDQGSGNQTLYDPNGGYVPPSGIPPGSGGIHDSDDSNLQDFINWHEQQGSVVETHPLGTTPEQDQQIIDNILDQPSSPPFGCAISSSSALGGACGIDPTWWPSDLAEQASESTCR